MAIGFRSVLSGWRRRGAAASGPEAVSPNGAGELPLKFLVLTVTYACQLRCEQCHMWRHGRGDEELSGEEWLRVVRGARAELGPELSVVLAGGEPLVKPYCVDLLAEISRLGMRSVLVTNGYAIDEPMARRLADAGLREMNISLDGYAETHDRLRGREGAYARVWQAIDWLKRYRPDICINILSILMEPNLEELPRLIREVDTDPRINGVVLQALAETFGEPHVEGWEKSSSLWPTDMDRLDAAIAELIRLKESGARIHWDLPHLRALGAYFHDPSNFVTAVCRVGDQSMTVDRDGAATLCGKLPSLGSVREKSVAELWNSDSAAALRAQTHNCRQNCHVILNCPFD
jgi:MoaA/NifB/PqqE/SkfB family radical SAM enzyme